MHEWWYGCVCMCMSVLCLRGRCVFCVAFPAWVFSYIFNKAIEYLVDGFSRLYFFYVLHIVLCWLSSVLCGSLAGISLFTLFVYLGCLRDKFEFRTSLNRFKPPVVFLPMTVSRRYSPCHPYFYVCLVPFSSVFTSVNHFMCDTLLVTLT